MLSMSVSNSERHSLKVRNYKLRKYILSYDLPVNIANAGYCLWLRECHIPCRIIWDGEILHGLVTTNKPVSIYSKFEFITGTKESVLIKLIKHNII